MATTNDHTHTAFADRPGDRRADRSIGDATAIYPPRSIFGNARGVLVTIFKVIWALSSELSIKSKVVVAGILMFYLVALVKDSYFFGTPQEWRVGVFSFTCVCVSIYGIGKLLEWREARDAQKPPVTEDVERLRATVAAVNEEGERAEKRRKQNVFSSSVGSSYYD